MKQILLTLFTLFSFFFVSDEYQIKKEAEEFTQRMHTEMENVANVTHHIVMGPEKRERLIGKSNDGNDMNFRCYPNDLYDIGFADFKEARIDIIFKDIENLSKNHNVHLTCTLLRSDFANKPKLKKNEDGPDYCKCSFEKTWQIDGKKYIVYEDVWFSIKYKNIPLIIIDKIEPDPTIPQPPSSGQDGQPEESEEVMMANAAFLYDCGRYNEAAGLYEKITKKHPKNDDAWYYLGVMYFKGQGVGKISKRQRLEKAEECWKKSNLKKACQAIAYISDGRRGC